MTTVKSLRRRRRPAAGVGAGLLLALVVAVLGPAGGSSAATARAQAVPGNTAAPTIVGSVRQGSGVAASTGAWSNSPTSFAYQWSRCAGTCSPIGGATAETYLVTSADAGAQLKVTVTATNASGSASQDSASATVGALPAGAPAVQAPPAVSGTAKQGQTLTATSGSWTGGTLAYAWLRCDTTGTGCSAISGAGGLTYTLAAADAGSTVRLQVTAGTGSATSTAVSAKTAVVAGGSAPVNTDRPWVAGTVAVGATITAQKGTWTGDAPITYAYQWQRCSTSGSSCSNVGAASASYAVGSADVGHTLVVVVTAQNASGAASAKSVPTAVVAASAKPANQTKPSISGNTTANAVLTANPGSWSGSQPISLSYQWQRCDANGRSCGNVAKATASTFRLTTTDVGRRLRVVVTARNSVGQASATSATTAVVGAGAPVSTSAPAVSGTLRQGATVSARVGAWSSATPITYHYQWFRCDASGASCSGIVGASNASYVLTSADVGHRLLVQVRAQNSAGSATANSKPSGVVAAAAGSGPAVAVSGLALPDRLEIDRVSFSPKAIGSRAQPLVARFHVREIQGGRPVSGALVKAIAIPYDRLSSAQETATDGNGWATVTFTVRKSFPLRKGNLVTIFVRARKPGGDVLAGISTRRLVSIRVR